MKVGEGSYLLTEPADITVKPTPTVDPSHQHMSIPGCSLTLLMTTMGTGTLCIPYTFALLPSSWTLTLLVLAAICICCSAEMLVVSSENSGVLSYNMLARRSSSHPF